MPTRRDEENRLRTSVQRALLAHITAQGMSYARIGERTGLHPIYVRQALGSGRPLGTATAAAIAWALGLRLVLTIESIEPVS